MNIRPCGIAVLAGVWTLALIVLGAAGAVAQTTPEFRAYWVESLNDPGLKSASQVDALMSTVRASNMNAVVVQERRRGDTYYSSSIEPWAPDANQSFDSLAYIIQKAHNESPRIDVIVWLCTFPVWKPGWAWPASSKHVLNKHPEWLDKARTGETNLGSNYCLDPGNPAAMQYTVDVAMEVVNKYDIDGINFDYVRYPEDTVNGEAAWGYNDVAVARFHSIYGGTGLPSNTDSNWKQFRRDQVTSFVRKIYASAIAVKPKIKVTADTITWGGGPTSDSGWYSTSAYNAVWQDWRAWMQEGIVDINMPMTYYAGTSSSFDSWIIYQKSHKYNRHLSIGLGSYLSDQAGVLHQLNETRQPAYWGGQNYYTDGQQFYDYNEPYLNNWDAAGFASYLRANFYTQPVPVPDMPWKKTPTKGHIKGTALIAGNGIDYLSIGLTGPESRSMRTDGTGFYAFIDLAPGAYTVSATYGSSARTTTVNVTAGNVSTVDFDYTADPTPPILTNIRSESIGTSSANVCWSSDDFATSQVDYGTTTSYGSTTALDPSLLQTHTVALTGLFSGSTYHYRVRSRNGAGLETVSGDYTFATFSDRTAPVISNITVTSIAPTSAVVSWSTDDASTTQVQYGLSSVSEFATTENMAFITSHSVTLTGLTPNTSYHFRVKSMNSAMLTSYSAEDVFLTAIGTTEIIVDNPQATSTGSWNSGAYPGGYPIDAPQYMSSLTVAGTGTATFTWTPTITVPGKYDVYCWYNIGSNRTTQAKYTTYYAGGNTSYTYDQHVGTDGTWKPLATGLQFNAGTSGYVRLTNGVVTAESGKYVIADAIRFVLSDSDTPTVPTNLVATAVSESQINLTWAASTDSSLSGYKIYRNGHFAGSSLTTSFADTNLAANAQCAYTVSAYDAKANESAQSASVARYTLALAPTTSNVLCSKMGGVWYGGMDDAFIFLSNVVGTGKQVSYYRFAWDNSPTHTWTETEAMWTTTYKTCHATSTGQAWYFHAKAYNAENVSSGSLDHGPYYFDNTPPAMNSVNSTWYVRRNGDSYDDLRCQWAGTDGESGLAEYQYAIGTTSGALDILAWTSAGTDTSATYTVPDAASHPSYYWTVKCRDIAGNWSTDTVSHVSVYADAYDSLAAALNNPDGTAVIVSPALVVGGNFGGYCYVQETNRSCGVRLSYTDAAWLPGDQVNVAGKLAGTSGERQLIEVQCTARTASSGNAPRPLGMIAPAVGGGRLNPYTIGISGAGAPYNTGLLVRVAGKVASHASGSFVLDDGSGLTVKVYSDKPVTDSSSVGVTGVSAVEGGQRVIRARTQADVQVYAP